MMLHYRINGNASLVLCSTAAVQHSTVLSAVGCNLACALQVRLGAAECLLAAARLVVQLDAAQLPRTSAVRAGVRVQLKEALQGALDSDVNAGVKSTASAALARLG